MFCWQCATRLHQQPNIRSETCRASRSQLDVLLDWIIFITKRSLTNCNSILWQQTDFVGVGHSEEAALHDTLQRHAPLNSSLPQASRSKVCASAREGCMPKRRR